MYASKLYKANGDIKTVFPKAQRVFTNQELEGYVKGAYECSEIWPMQGAPFVMVTNKASRERHDKGSMKADDEYNRIVSNMLGSFILGDVLFVCNLHRT